MTHSVLRLFAPTLLLVGCSSGHPTGDASTRSDDGGADSGVDSASGSDDGIGTESVTYDTAIGNGVDAVGFADLPLRAGAHRYFVNASTGSDDNSCDAAQSPSTPKATAAAGLACTTPGEADQLLIAERTTYATALPSMAFRAGGYSLLYPMVLQSYDPTDPLNETKYGRASGSNRPVFTGDTAGTPWVFGGNQQSFIAVRGLEINPGNIPEQGVGMVDVGSGILFENNVFRYGGVGIGINASPRAQHWIFRNNAIVGGWSAAAATAGQGIYADGTDTLTIEDNVFFHNGWKIGANRTDPIEMGGATQFRHPVYQQVPTDGIFRRNLVVDGSADGGSFRGNISHSANVIIDCPIAASLGGGTSYDTGRPTGVTIESSYNAIIGSARIPDSGAAGWGIASQNGRPGSSAHHNLLVRSDFGSQAFLTSVLYNQPSYMDFHDNVSYQWSPPGETHYDGAADVYPGLTHTTYENNLWDDPTSATNTSNSGTSFPNPYTAAQLYTAMGYGDKQAFVDDAIAHPESHLQRRARALLFVGYGLR